jgi:hypothetical protein
MSEMSTIQEFLDSPKGKEITLDFLVERGRQKLERMRKDGVTDVSIGEFWWLLPALTEDKKL